jgi:hypothetical protein
LLSITGRSGEFCVLVYNVLFFVESYQLGKGRRQTLPKIETLFKRTPVDQILIAPKF